MPFQDALASAQPKKDDDMEDHDMDDDDMAAQQAAEAIVSLSPAQSQMSEQSPLSSYVSLLSTPDLRGFTPWLGGMSSDRMLPRQGAPRNASGWSSDSRLAGQGTYTANDSSSSQTSFSFGSKSNDSKSN